jgi:hypothetical protein
LKPAGFISDIAFVRLGNLNHSTSILCKDSKRAKFNTMEIALLRLAFFAVNGGEPIYLRSR